MNISTDKPWHLRVLPDLLAFVLGLSAAYFLNWSTRDLVWSLWLCSLVLGYLTLLSTLAAGGYLGLFALRHPDSKPQDRKKLIIGGTIIGLFFLGFFSLHFCGFHAGHSVFLNAFFPLEGMPRDGFGRAFVNPLLLWALVFKHLMVPYGIFLLPAIISERKHVFAPLLDAFSRTRGEEPAAEALPNLERLGGRKGNPVGQAMSRPYINVVRMHILIFFFAFCSILKIESFFVFAVVYSVYFFPWAELKGWWQSRKRDTPAREIGEN